MANIFAAWMGFLLGCVAGAVPGLFFHEESWLGGYASWPRRMLRLAHVAFFGLGFLNLGFGLTARAMGFQTDGGVESALLIAGAVAMPAVCYLSAWKKAWRRLFFVPAAAVTGGIALFAWRVLTA